MNTKIRVNIITGFLGVGKTTCIQSLLQRKPSDETWAVLVNEYGQQGIDGALLQTSDIIVKQIAGGCACCAALMPFQIALNQLIRQERPHRIFIEPSGLGHVDKIIELLQDEQYHAHLALHATICLVDARQLSQPKYRYHELYQRQLHAADVLVASKTDLAEDKDMALFQQLVHETGKASENMSKAQLPFSTLEYSARPVTKAFYLNQSGATFLTEVIYFSAKRWNLDRLTQVVSDLNVLRIKGLFVQHDQVVGINKSQSECTQQVFALLNAEQVSVMECIDDKAIDTQAIQQAVEACIEHD